MLLPAKPASCKRWDGTSWMFLVEKREIRGNLPTDLQRVSSIMEALHAARFGLWFPHPWGWCPQEMDPAVCENGKQLKWLMIKSSGVFWQGGNYGTSSVRLVLQGLFYSLPVCSL